MCNWAARTTNDAAAGLLREWESCQARHRDPPGSADCHIRIEIALEILLELILVKLNYYKRDTRKVAILNHTICINYCSFEYAQSLARMAVVSILTDFGKLEWLALILCLIAARLILVYFTTIKYPANLPRVGEKEGATRFRLSTRLRFFTDAQRLQKEAYEKVVLGPYPSSFVELNHGDSKLMYERELTYLVVYKAWSRSPHARSWLQR